MSSKINTRKKGDYVCLDFPKRGISLLYNTISGNYEFYKSPKSIIPEVRKVKKDPIVSVVQFALASALGVILAVHAYVLISKLWG